MRSAVIIVNWNSGTRLRRCLESLPPTPGTVVVDNASQDNSVQQARDAGVPATFIENSVNRGLAAGINQGLGATSTPYVLLLNPDVCVTPGSVEILERVLDENSRTGAVGGYVNARYLPRPLASPWTVIRENCGFPPGFVDSPVVGQAAAAALLVRRQACVEAGGFDEQFFPAWYEDVDFSRRLAGCAWEVRFASDARFLHEGGYSAGELGATAFASAYYRNQLRYIRKHFGWGAGLLVRLSIIAGMAARGIVAPSRARACSRVIVGALGGW